MVEGFMRVSRRMTILIAALALFALALPATAAPEPPSGTIDVDTSSARLAAATLSYGDDVGFTVTLDGKISKQARVYVSVICLQGSEVVYQWSGDPSFTFPLVDQAGQGLDWNGESADCTAALIHRVQKGKAAVITYLDYVNFWVNGTTA